MPTPPRHGDGRRNERVRRGLDVLCEVTRQLTAAHEVDAVLSLIVDEVTRVLDVDAAALYLREGDALVLRAGTDLVTASPSRARLPLGKGPGGEAVVASAAPDAPDLGLHGLLAVPLRASAGVVGIIHLYARRPRRFGGDDVRLA